MRHHLLALLACCTVLAHATAQGFAGTWATDQGILRLDVESGDYVSQFAEPDYPVIHDMVCSDGLMVLLVGNRVPTMRRPSGPEEIRLEAFRTDGDEAYPLWREVLGEEADELLAQCLLLAYDVAGEIDQQT